MNHEGLDQLVLAWCEHELGPGTLEPITPADGGQMSTIFRFETAVHASIAIKVRDDSPARVDGCLKVQQLAADSGLPCARPITGAQTLANGLVVSGEEWRPGGEMMAGDGPVQAGRSGELLAGLIRTLEPCSPEGLGPPPPWMDWNYTAGALWPPNDPIDRMDQSLVPAWVGEMAERASERLRASVLPDVVGHGDWEAQNIRWKGRGAWAIHDWDSLVGLPEAAIVGAASGAFASARTPTLAPIRSSAAFIRAYEQARDRTFSDDERQMAWAASLWPALHNARGECLFQSSPVATTALKAQGAERLALAHARRR
jgi:hypothetical protein